MAEDAFVTDFEHIMADDITDDVRFIMYDSESGKTASAGEVSKYMMKNVHVDTTLTEEGAAAEAKAVGGALAKKADTKGRYEDIVAGGAEQLMADGHESDTEPYLFRPTGGSADVGNREYLDKIVGGTVAWNQLEKLNRNTETKNGITFTRNGDGSMTLDGTATNTDTFLPSLVSGAHQVINGHKYLLMSSMPTNISGLSVTVFIGGSPKQYAQSGSNAFIYAPTGQSGVINLCYSVVSGTTISNVKVFSATFDLTAMFGTTIADYIYSLEQATAGAGVAWFRNYFPKDYYPYDKGTLRSVEGVSAHETVGKNLLPVTVANIKAENSGTTWNGNTTTINGITFTVQTDEGGNVVGINANGTATADIVFFVSSAIDGSITESCTLTGCPSGGSSATYYQTINYFGYDYGSGKTATIGAQSNRKARIDIKSGTTASNLVFKPMLRLASETDSTYEPYTKHTYTLDSSLTLRGVPKLVDGKLAFDGDIYPPSGEVQRRYGLRAYQSGDESLADAITDGTNTVYKLATPTTETAEGYEHYQICDPIGTEEFVTTGIVPVGHETRYPHDLKKKIETAPDSPSTDGTYLMKRSGGKNTYMALPSTPSANGAYVLTVTVSGGTASYSWTAKE